MKFVEIKINLIVQDTKKQTTVTAETTGVVRADLIKGVFAMPGNDLPRKSVLQFVDGTQMDVIEPSSSLIERWKLATAES